MMPNRGSRLSAAALLAAAALTLGLSVASPAAAAPFEGVTRSFDAEPVGSAPTGCSTVGDVSVQPAALAGAPAQNRAVRLVDASATVHTRIVCTDPASPEKSATMRLLATQMDTGVIVSLGASSADALGVWRFFLSRSGGDVVVKAYNGSSWVTLGTAPGVDPLTRWIEVRLDATASKATIEVDRVRFPTTVKAGAGASIGALQVASEGTAPSGLSLLVDDMGMAPSVPEFREVVAATAAAGTAIRFPGAERLGDGTILASYYEAPTHAGSNGVIKLVRSTDDGATWSAPALVTDPAYDPRDPKLAVLSDGTVLLTYFYTQWASPSILHGTFVMRSTDGGVTWSAPTQVSTQMSCACGPVSGGYPLGWAANHGPIVEAANGDLLIPLYGTLPGDGRQRATVVRSTDGGITWDAASEALLAVGSISFQEPNLSVLPSGEIVALIRTTSSPVRAYLSRSFDDGHTWTPAVATDIPAESHSQTVLADGSVLLTYGNPARPGRPTEGIVIDDPSGPWDGRAARSILVYDAGNGDQANPSNVEIGPGEFLTMSYDVAARTLSAVFTERSHYAD
ncbi:glycoside hydrolase [Microbacterium resistens]|uniref:Glycoside hydrolase n=1 Tax=Microbacterium resistens TaxID=156977 RepID=A0ABY3RQT7_9MICO|nr:sialidase family protein [Microbacterium resistens]UGS25245.1 glycoside hydrolase [Microbacterium resistens]